MTSKQTLATELRRLADEIEFRDASCKIDSRTTRTSERRMQPVTDTRDFGTTAFRRTDQRDVTSTTHSISVTTVEHGEWTMKQFTRAQPVDVRRDTNKPWEPAEYDSPCTDWRGWHRVTLPAGAPRRIDAMTGHDCGPDNPRGFLTRNLFVLSCRIRPRAEVSP